MNANDVQLPWYAYAAIAIVLLVQGTWLFIDARKHGKRYWFWGLWGMIYFPLPSILYLLFSRKIFSKRHRQRNV